MLSIDSTASPRTRARIGLTLILFALLASASSPARAEAAGWGTPLQLSEFSYPEDSDQRGEPLSDGRARVAGHLDGAVTVVWTRPGAGILARDIGTDGRAGTSRTVVAHDATLLYYLEVAPLGSSRTLVSYVRRDGTRYRIKARVLQSSGTFGDELDLGPTSEGDGTPDYTSAAALTDNGDGTATAAWTVRSGDNYIVRERRIDQNAVVGQSYDLASLGSASGGELGLAGHGDGTATIAWYSTRRIDTQLATTPQLVRVGKGGAIGPVRDVQPESSYPEFGSPAPQLAAHADGSTTVAWTLSGGWGYYWQIAERVVAADGSMTDARNIVQPCTSQSSVYQCNSSYSGAPNISVTANGDGTATIASFGYSLGAAIYRVDQDGTPHGDGQVNPTGSWGLPQADSSRAIRLTGNGDGTATVVYAGSEQRLVSRIAASSGVRDETETIAQGPDVNVSDFTITRGSGTQLTAAWLNRVSADAWGDGKKSFAVFAAQRGVAGEPPQRVSRMVAFGDSYTSGEGLTAEPGLRYDCGTDMHQGMYRQDTTVLAERSWSSLDCDTRTLSGTQPSDLYQRPFRKHENLCHRQARAYPNQIRSALKIDLRDYMFVACNGAETKHVGLVDDTKARFPNSPVNVHGGKTQIDTVDPGFTQNGSPDLVTIGIGGNDAAFAQIIEQCLRGDCLDSEFRQGTIAKINGSTFDRLVETFKGLTDRLPDATVLAFGYPEVVGDPDKPCGRVNALQLNVGSWNISHDELEWITSEVEPALNRAIRDAAAQAGVVYVDIEAATHGHELCSDTDDRWINGLVGGDDRKIDSGEWIGNESFHPNQKAHDAISRYFIARYTDGAGRLSIHNPDPSTPPRPAPGPEIYLGSLEAGAVRPCGEDCRQPTRCVPGCSIRVEGGGFAPSSQLTVTLHSEPAVLGTIQVDDEGHLAGDLATPTDTPPGIHLIKLTGRSSDGRSQYGGAFIEVFEAATPPLGSLPILPALPKGPQGKPSGPISSLTPRISSPVSARWRRKGRATRVASMVVRRIPRAATVKVECKRPKRISRPSGCRFGVKEFKMKRARRSLSLAKLFGRPLRARTRVTISITQPGWIGKRVVFAVRRTGKPRTTRYCLPVGSSVARREC